jgi:hypothetical protein
MSDTIIGKILYFAGYTFDFESNMSKPPLDIEVGRHNTYVARPRTKQKENIYYQIFRWIYTAIIFMSILWSVPYTLYMSLRESSFSYFGRSWFQIMIGIQYYYGITYFGKDHFYENIVCKTELMKYIKYSMPISFIISLSLAVFSVCLLTLDFKVHPYEEIYINATYGGRITLCILLFMDIIYSYLTFTLNACIFAVNMLYHKNTVEEYSNEMDTFIKNSMSTVRKLNIIANDFSQMKDNFDKTVVILTPFFTTLNFLGFSTMYFYLGASTDGTITPMEIVNIILFLMIQIIYITSIQSVNSNIGEISGIILSNSVITTFFGNKRVSKSFPLSDKHFSNDELSLSKNLSEIKKDDQQYIISDLNIQRHDYHDHDYHDHKSNDYIIDHNNHIDQNSHIQIIPDPTNNANANIDYSREYHRENGSNNVLSSSGIYRHNVSNESHDALNRIIISSISTEQMIEWLILQGIVANKWQSFSMFGVEFTGTSLIAKLAGIIIGLLITSEFASFFNWW